MITALDKNTALILIDLQKGITGSPGLAHPVATVLANANKLVEAFHKADLPVVFVTVNVGNAAWLHTRKDLKMPGGERPADWAELDDSIKAKPGDIFITKHTWSAFYETALEEELKKRNITGIVIGGISTSIGVEGTARNASERGYNIAFAVDAMTDRAAESHEHSVKSIFPRMGEVDTTDNIIKLLS